MVQGLARGEQGLIQLAGCVLIHGGKHMCVGVQCDAYIGMAQAMLDYLCADSCGDECGSIAMAKSMQIRIR